MLGGAIIASTGGLMSYSEPDVKDNSQVLFTALAEPPKLFNQPFCEVVSTDYSTSLE
jgi:hypothetical protein